MCSSSSVLSFVWVHVFNITDTKLVHSRELFGTTALLCLLILSPYQTDLFSFSVNRPSQVRGRAHCCSPCPADRSSVFNPQHLKHQIKPHLSWLSHISASTATHHLCLFIMLISTCIVSTAHPFLCLDLFPNKLYVYLNILK